MSDQIKQIAERIREMREIAGISAETLASKIGIDASDYINFEAGNGDISAGTMINIAEVFNIEVPVLFGGDNPRLHVYSIVRNGKGIRLDRRKQYRYESLAYNFINRKAEPFMVTVEPADKDKALEFNSHPGQEFYYLTEGRLMVMVDNHEIVMNAGDSLYFDSGYRHAMKALDDQPAKLLVVVI